MDITRETHLSFNYGVVKMNAGKKFEEDWRNSVPEGIFLLRLKDGGGWGNGTNTRFTPSNECDAIMFDGQIFYMLEFKSHEGASIPFTCIRDKQLESLRNNKDYKNLRAGFVFNFRDAGNITIYVDGWKVWDYINNADRKSIPIGWIVLNGVEIKNIKKISRYRYDIQGFCQTIRSEK
jgi:recombination protein U